MSFLRYYLSGLKRLTEVVKEELHLLWGETALCGNVARGGETCREFGVRANPLVEFFKGGAVVDVGTIGQGKFFFCCINHSGMCYLITVQRY